MAETDLLKKFIVENLDNLCAADNQKDCNNIFRYLHGDLIHLHRFLTDEIREKELAASRSDSSDEGRFISCDQCYFYDHQHGCTFDLVDPDEEDYIYKSEHCYKEF